MVERGYIQKQHHQLWQSSWSWSCSGLIKHHLDCFKYSWSSVPGSVCSRFFEASSQNCGSLCHGYRRRQWQPTPVPLPGKSYGRRSLVGCSPCGHEELDMTEWLSRSGSSMSRLQSGHQVVNFFHRVGVSVATRPLTDRLRILELKFLGFV